MKQFVAVLFLAGVVGGWAQTPQQKKYYEASMKCLTLSLQYMDQKNYTEAKSQVAEAQKQTDNLTKAMPWSNIDDKLQDAKTDVTRLRYESAKANLNSALGMLSKLKEFRDPTEAKAQMDLALKHIKAKNVDDSRKDIDRARKAIVVQSLKTPLEKCQDALSSAKAHLRRQPHKTSHGRLAEERAKEAKQRLVELGKGLGITQ